jgi:uncharacterized SAM-binding protein YcdF (DUF218 family)
VAATPTIAACTITERNVLAPLAPKDPKSAATTAGEGTRSKTQKRLWGLLRQRSCLVPTFKGWAFLLIAVVVLAILFTRALLPFLAVNQPISDGLLAVEGWTPDYGLEAAVEEFKRDHYQKIYVTGGPLDYGTYLNEYKTYAQLGAANLVKLGLDSNVVQAVPAPRVRQDRTYTSAVTLKQWLLAHDIKPTRIHLISEGPHTRRSRLLYEKAMGPGVVIGVTSIPSRAYDQDRWWHYSAGVRNVLDEALAYLYARFLFYPPKQS